jgi:hypothetical protein
MEMKRHIFREETTADKRTKKTYQSSYNITTGKHNQEDIRYI